MSVIKKVPGKITWKIESKPLEKFKHRYAPKFFKYNPLLCSFTTIYIFFSKAVLRKLFDIWFSYKHCSFSQVCLLVKMTSKTVTNLYTSKTLLLKELYRSFLSMIAVIVIFLLGFLEFCCDAGTVFPCCNVDNYRICGWDKHTLSQYKWSVLPAIISFRCTSISFVPIVFCVSVGVNLYTMRLDAKSWHQSESRAI